MDLKQCKKCKEWKELSEFHKYKKTKDGLYIWYKLCKKEWDKKRYKDNSEKIKEKVKKWYKDNITKRKPITNKWNNKYCLYKSTLTNKIRPYEEIRQNGEFLEVKCTYCGKWFKPKNNELQSRLNTINGTKKGENRFYCTNNCKKECPIYRKVKYPKGFKKATSREVQPELRQLVLERDNYTCQKYGLTQDELKVGLHCHHKEGILWEPLMSADMDMCITYCKSCHKEVHKIEGCKTNDMRCPTRII